MSGRRTKKLRDVFLSLPIHLRTMTLHKEKLPAKGIKTKVGKLLFAGYTTTIRGNSWRSFKKMVQRSTVNAGYKNSSAVITRMRALSGLR